MKKHFSRILAGRTANRLAKSDGATMTHLNGESQHSARTADSKSDRFGRMFCMRGLMRVALVAVMAMVFGMAGFVGSAEAVVTPLGSWTVSTAVDNITHSAPAGDNRANVVMVSEEAGGALVTGMSGCTGNMVRIGTRSDGNNSFAAFYEILGTSAGSTDCTMTITGSSSGNTIIYAGTFENVLQAEGADDTPAIDEAVYSSIITGGNPGQLSITLTGTPATPTDGLVIVGGEHNENLAWSNITGGWTTATTTPGASHAFIAGVRDVTTESNSVSFSADQPVTDRWTGVMFALTPAVSCIPDPAPTMNGGSFSGDPMNLCAAVTAGTNTVTNYEITSVSLAGDDFNDASLDSKWTKVDIGPDTTGVPVESGGTLTLTGGGADIWNTADEFTFLYQQVTGDFTMQVNVQSITNTGGNAWHKSGLMARESLNGNSANVNMVVTQGNGVSLQNRPTTGAAMVNQTDAVGTAPKWIRVERIGNNWRGWWSNDGSSWTENSGGTNNVTLPNTIYIGLGVTSHSSGIFDTAVFDDFVVTGGTSTLYSGASCSGIPTGTWGDATYDLNITYTDSCSASGQTASGTIDFASCSESTPSSIIWNGNNTSSGDFAGASFITPTDITGATLQYKVTGSVSNPPFPTQSDDFAGLPNGTTPNFGNWTGVDSDEALNGWVALSGGTGSGTTGPSAGNPDPYIYLESSGTGQTYAVGVTAGSQNYIESNVLDASAYSFDFTFDWDMNVNGNTDAELHIDGWDGTAWIAPDSGSLINTGNNGDTWVTEGPVDFSSFTNADFQIRIRYIVGGNGNIYQNDIAVDNMVISGSPRTSQATIIDWTTDLVPGMANLADATSYNLFARGDDPECGITYYGDAGAQTIAEGTSTPFTWTSCPEGATVSVFDPGVITGPTPIIVNLGGSGGTPGTEQWSDDGGTTWYASGSNYTPAASCATGSVAIIGRATGSCGGTIYSTTLNQSWDTTDSGPGGDLATLTVTPDGGSVTGVTKVEVAVGTESTPDSLSNMVLNVTGSTACNVSNSVLSWNGGSSRWEVNWDTSACATGAAENDVTLTVTATDIDCNDFVTDIGTVTIDNTCDDPTSTVSWSPPGGTIEAPIVVSVSRSGGIAGYDEVSFDDGNSWLPSGSTYTPDVDDHGTENFWVRAYDTCGKWMYGGPYAVNIDGRLDEVRPLSVVATSAGQTTIRVLLRYASDKNNNAATTLKYKLNSDPDIPESWTTIGPVVDGSDEDNSINENVLFLLNALTTDNLYDIEVDVTDADGVNWTTLQVDSPAAPPWKASVMLTSWTDTPLLHNALRFACSEIGYADESACVAAGGSWFLDRKWIGGWGLPDADYPGNEYGAINCSTCHMKNSSNIKRVITSVTAANGSFPGSGVNLQTVTEGSSDLGDDSVSHATSNKVCEVCHSKTTYHRYDNTSGQTNFAHNNNTDCLRCHEHKVGFRASCDSCHGTPPVSNGGLVTTDPTGSTSWGEHQKHAVDIGYDCATCHNGWDGTNQMPNSGDLNIGFKSSVNVQFNGAAETIDGGTYEGRPSASANYTVVDGITTLTQDTATADMSCAVYCHGYGVPIWNPTSTVACGFCHGEVNSGVGYRSGAPTGIGASKDLSGATSGFAIGKHATHLDDSVARTGDPCALCHNGYSYTDLTHVNGTINVSLHPSADLDTGGGVLATYTPGAGGGGEGECSNMNCHGTTPWDSAAVLTCTQSCHAYPPSGGVGSYIAYPANGGTINFVDHETPNGSQYLKDNHGQCKYCHGWNDDGDGALPIIGMTAAELSAMNGDPTEAPNFFNYNNGTGIGQHNESAFVTGKITMNADANANEADDSGYNPANGGCDNAVCHGNDAAHRFNVGGGSGNTIVAADIGPGDCGACHTTGVGGATVVTPSSPHTTVTRAAAFDNCTNCHAGHYSTAGGVKIPNNTDVGINYLGAAHGGIQLGGPGTDASISAKTTEAEICWGCHDLAANNISEWGTNLAQPGSPVPTAYDYGSVSTSDWTTATWTSGYATEFAYKTGAIQSTHAANPAGTSALTGPVSGEYGFTETVDDVANIRCSYCHDVHDAVGPDGAPYLRGTWWGNPYEEDGAPQSGTNYSNTQRFGAVPRGNGANQRYLGGFWIDINNVQPGTSSETGNGTAYYNPTASGGTGPGGSWTMSDSAGICILCHGNNPSTMDETTGEGLWFSTNGHSNAVIQGAGGGANIFNNRGTASACNDSDSLMHWSGCGRPEDVNSGFRNGNESRYNYSPMLNPGNTENTEDTTPGTNNWGSITLDNTTINANYHKFSCSKCHNPHASRLPKLMITNCLDTKHNTWDDSPQLNAATGLNNGRSISNWTSAQNCHRLGGSIPTNQVIPSGGTYPEPVDTGASGATHQTGTSYGNRGWNRVTPW